MLTRPRSSKKRVASWDRRAQFITAGWMLALAGALTLAGQARMANATASSSSPGTSIIGSGRLWAAA